VAVKDGERGLGGISDRATTCWKPSARSLLERSRHPIAGCKDKQVSSCVLIRGRRKEGPVAGGSEGRAEGGKGKRCKGEARPLNTYRVGMEEGDGDRERRTRGQRRSDLPRLEAVYIVEE